MIINPTPQRTPLARGLSLLELTIIILVLMSFISLMFVGVRAWKHGSDRAACIINIRQVQLAVRSYANTEGLQEDTDTSLLSPPVNLAEALFGPDKYIVRHPTCPGEGLYHLGGNEIPPRGILYMTCTTALKDGHVPDDFASW